MPALILLPGFAIMHWNWVIVATIRWVQNHERISATKRKNEVWEEKGMDIEKNYLRWCNCAKGDPDLVAELAEMAGKPEQIEDAFYRELEFGTGGLRGVIGAGTNRMNIYTVGKASQGLANYVIAHFPPEKRRIAISYDSRIKSDLFSKVAAGVFAANKIEVWIYPTLMPTPCLSYAVRELDCAAGIMVTASHNPSKYNGYKVYGPDGWRKSTGQMSLITWPVWTFPRELRKGGSGSSGMRC